MWETSQYNVYRKKRKRGEGMASLTPYSLVGQQKMVLASQNPLLRRMLSLDQSGTVQRESRTPYSLSLDKES